MKYNDTIAMRFLFISFFIFCIAIANAQFKVQVNFLQPKNNLSNDTIYYNPSQKLTWADFKGIPQANHIALAVTTSGFGYNGAMKSINGKGILTVDVFCYFSKQLSWVKPNKSSDYALTHEQHHFDVSYIATNIFVKKLKESKFTMANYSALLNEIYNASLKQMESMQNSYDGETKNGQLKNIQATWNNKLDAELKTWIKR